MFSDPVKNLKAFGIRDDDVVADLGAGTGFYSLALGYMAPRGRVYAVDIVKDFLTTIKNKAKEARLPNIEILLGNIEKIGGTKIGDSVVDRVVASNVLFQLEDKDNFVLEIKRIMKPGGRVLLVDWSPDSVVKGLKGIVAPGAARAIFEQKGFIFERDINAGAHHYGMILIS